MNTHIKRPELTPEQRAQDQVDYAQSLLDAARLQRDELMERIAHLENLVAQYEARDEERRRRNAARQKRHQSKLNRK